MVKWFLYLPLDLLVNALAYPIAPILALFADGKGDVRLSQKNILRLWLTPDNPIEGNAAQYERWEKFVSKFPRFGMFCQRTAWLWRNKAYGWEQYVFSVEIEDVDYIGNPLVGDIPYVKGWCLAWAKGAWMVYVVLPTFKTKCLRIYFGWKLRPFCLQKMRGKVEKGDAQIAFAINPWKSRG